MASPLRLTVARDGPCERAWAAVRHEFEAVEAAMSRFRESSELTRLNRLAGTGLGFSASRRLELALAISDRARRLTGGWFEPRVLRALEGLGDTGAPIPARSAGRRSATNRIVEHERGSGMRLAEPVDLGGIGKGLALRWAADRVRRLGVADFVLEAGGDVVAAGSPPVDGPGGSTTWRVGIEDPAGGAAPLAVVELCELAIATSSTRVRRWVHGGGLVHHLVDPRTGMPGGAGLAAVTVAGPDPAWAEIWSKALFLEGDGAVRDRADELGLTAWWSTDDGRFEMTAGARRLTTWVRDETGPSVGSPPGR